MKISILHIVNSLEKMLLQFPGIVDGLKNKDYDFLKNLDDWMVEAEKFMMDQRMAECSKIAGLRSKIAAPLFSDRPRQLKKRDQIKAAAECLNKLQGIVTQSIEPYKKRIIEADELLIQMLQVLRQSGVIKYKDGTEFQSFIREIWNILSQNEQLKPAILKLNTLITPIDAQLMIAEEINLEEWR
jgi:hypothetical protein